jgi:alpha-glucosidase
MFVVLIFGAGYTLSSVNETSSGLTAQLTLAGAACNAFGSDVQNLTIAVAYESNTRYIVLHYE